MDRMFSSDPAKSQGFNRNVGRLKASPSQEPVSLKLDPKTLAKFKATGPGWARRMNDVLKASLGGLDR